VTVHSDDQIASRGQPDSALTQVGAELGDSSMKRESQPRLTKVAKRAGCAAKQPPGYLLPLLAGLPKPTDANVLVGSATVDDAAVYRLDAERALVLTTDFFTPIVDDAYQFGAIAAANALSDVYAMGGTPLAALSVVGFPDELLESSVLADILRGGAEKAAEAGIDIVGGHTIRADEPIYGLSVTGIVHPEHMVTNAGARPSDLLVLTKPLGVGIVTTAAKNDDDSERAIDEAVRLMSTLNRDACEAMLEIGVNAATDVTGFGLLGHLRNLLCASGTSASLWLDDVPILPAADAYVRRGIAPGGTRANHRFVAASVEYGPGVPVDAQLLLADAQTSGGLLIAVPEERAPALVAALARRNSLARAVIGRVEAGTPGAIRVSHRR
jgi:selenide,water dikinase